MRNYCRRTRLSLALAIIVQSLLPLLVLRRYFFGATPLTVQRRCVTWTAPSIPSKDKWRVVVPTSVEEFYGTINGTVSNFDAKSDSLTLVDDETVYFLKYGRAVCFLHGVDVNQTQEKNTCVCRPGWTGTWCSIPSAIAGNLARIGKSIQRRERPRRIVYSMPFNMEFDILEAYVNELEEVVAAFQIIESNYTKYGDPKGRFLYKALRLGYLSYMRNKIVYIKMDTYPKDGRKNGWVAEGFWFDSHGSLGFREHIKGSRDDDIFLMTDVDEMISKDVLYFLMLHDGYPEPFGFILRSRTFGFYWALNSGTVMIPGGCTVGLLRDVVQYRTSRLRNPSGTLKNLRQRVKHYMSQGGLIVPDFLFLLGSSAPYHPVGWHCSWCLPPEHIVIKLMSAINADFPRWGDYPDRRRLPYIRQLIRSGTYFDNKLRLHLVPNSTSEFAPPFMLGHHKRYRYLLENLNPRLEYSDENTTIKLPMVH